MSRRQNEAPSFYRLLAERQQLLCGKDPRTVQSGSVSFTACSWSAMIDRTTARKWPITSPEWLEGGVSESAACCRHRDFGALFPTLPTYGERHQIS